MARRRYWIAILLAGLFAQAYTARAQEQNFRIAGTVVDARSGAPVTTAEVMIAGTNGRGMQRGAATDARGRFGFDHVVPGKYILSARAKGYPQQTLQQHENFSTAIAVGMDLDSENIVFRLVPSASLEGQVVDEFSEPIRRAQVMLFRQGVNDGSESVRIQKQITTDDQGRYRFTGLPSGRYLVGVSAQPWYAQHYAAQPGSANPDGAFAFNAQQNTRLDVVYPITYYYGVTDPAKASTFTLQPGERAMADFALQPVSALRLRVTAPVADVSQGMGVRITQPTLGGHEVPFPTQLMRNNQGYIDLTGIPPGPVIVNMDAPVAPGSKERRNWRQGVDASRNATVDITEVASTAEVRVAGTLKDISGRGLPLNPGIEMRDRQTGANFLAQASSDGKFEFQNGVRPGRYDLTLFSPAPFFMAGVEAMGAKVSGRSVEIGSEPVQLTVAVAAGTGLVQGVALRGGKPAGGVMMLLVPQEFEQGSQLFRRDQSDSDGTFTLIAVPGRYTLVAIENGWDQEWANPAVLKTWLKSGEAVDVAPSGKYNIKVAVQ